MKKFFATLVCLCICLVLVGLSAMAVGTAPAPTPTPILRCNYNAIMPSEQRVILDPCGTSSGAREATPEQIAEATLQATQFSKPIGNLPNATIPDTSWNYLDPFTYIPQEANYSCGPACVRMVLTHKTGSAPSEATVIAGCKTSSTAGTYSADILTYLNTTHNLNYSVAYGGTRYQLMSNIWTGIKTYSNPCIVGLRESTSDGWGFDLAAHFITVYSIRANLSEVALCDPWAQYVSTSSPFWYVCKTDTELHSAYNAVDVGMVY